LLCTETWECDIVDLSNEEVFSPREASNPADSIVDTDDRMNADLKYLASQNALLGCKVCVNCAVALHVGVELVATLAKPYCSGLQAVTAVLGTLIICRIL
jgi:Fe-S oxidoreductase